MKLTIELVPSTCFYTNLRSELPAKDWDKIRKKSYALADNKCEICGDTGKNQGYKHNVECHETWEYKIINGKRTQKLLGVVALCPICHKCKHPGLAGINGEMDLVYKQMMKVNKRTEAQIANYLELVFGQWRERSGHKWLLDITWLEESNYLK